MTHTIMKVIDHWKQQSDGITVPVHKYEVGMFVPNLNGAPGDCCWQAIAQYNTAVFAAHLIHYLDGGTSFGGYGVLPQEIYDEMMRGLL